MNYYYDLILNMEAENYFSFYEWERLDFMEHIKKIPLYRVDSETLNDFLEFTIKVDQSFLDIIQNKTILKNNKLNEMQYACLLCDTKNTIAIIFDNEGYVRYVNSILLEDDVNINEFIYSYKKVSINYERIKKRVVNDTLRQEKKIKKFIKLEINSLIEKNDFEKLRYLFYEWFSIKESDIEKIKKKVFMELDKDISDSMQHIYNIIMLSYNKQ